MKKVATDQAGHEVFLAAEKAEPSEILLYRATYTNRSAAPLREIVAMMPIPPGLAYVSGSASPEPAEATLEGKQFFSLLPAATPLPPVGQWRALRWAPRTLAPGEKFMVSLRAKVLAPESPSTPSR